MKTQTLYRHFNKDGKLLYVGISSRLGQRTKEHSEFSSWFESVAYITLEHFKTREEVVQAEVAAILNENPLHNVKHNITQGLSVRKREVEVISRHDAFIARFVDLPAMMPLSEWARVLHLPKNYLDQAIESKKLAAVDVGMKSPSSSKPRLFCTGWQIIDWLESLEVSNAS